VGYIRYRSDGRYRDGDGFLRCTHCEAISDENHTFCPHCGGPLKVYNFSLGNAANLSDADPEIRETPGGRVPVSSSGRGPRWDDDERRRYLESLPPVVPFSRSPQGARKTTSARARTGAKRRSSSPPWPAGP
jgi:hypothetical protein